MNWKKQTNYVFTILFCLLAVVWLIHTIFPVCYQVALKEIRSEQWESIDKGKAGQTTTFIVSHQQFKQSYQNADREFKLHGKMYDVIYYEVFGDSVYVKTVYDERESELHFAFSIHLQTEKTGKKTQSAMNWWWPLSYQPGTPGQLTVLTAIKISNKPSLGYHILLNGYSRAAIKPPEHSA